VDANVLIFERIREELAAGSQPQAAINLGYEKALSSIADANVTTLIAAIVLLAFGTGPIKGFAITLMIGILTSMFTAIVGTRAIVNLVFGGRKITSLPV
jgi:preprotein translocase subunit SecD